MSTVIKRALISVSDKTGVVDLVKALAALNIEILSTGGTARLLAEHGVSVLEVSDYTGFPEMMGGRLKTLHPKIHGGLLGRPGIDDSAMEEHGIQPIGLVVVNLYPFEQTVAQPDSTPADAIENIDIGGPAMLRGAAKNFSAVAVVVDPADYGDVLENLRTSNGMLSEQLRFDLAVKAFEHTARYDGAIANYLGVLDAQGERSDFPKTLNLQFQRAQVMRYGENPHQKAAFYKERDFSEVSVASSSQLQGKELSFNNLADADAALECVKTFEEGPACVIVKHANPCGVALGESLLDAYERAYRTDPTSAFGGIVAFNRSLDSETAETILNRQFVEVIVAPAVDSDTLPTLSSKKNVRVLVTGHWDACCLGGADYKHLAGGMLVQDRDVGLVQAHELKVVTQRSPNDRELLDLMFAWKVAKFVKSNAIVYCRNGATIGIGAGQMSRVYSAKIASIKAQDEGLELEGSVMASDAFFPFRDGVDSAAEAGITAVIQPGGSVRDEEVIAAAEEHGLAMVFTGMRHFRH